MSARKKWYVEATAHTNEVIARELPSENAHEDVLCQDGVKRDFWECEYRFITRLLENEATARLNFKVFYREGKYGPVKPWPFLRRRKLVLKSALEKGRVKKGVSPTQAL